jgi:phosphoglycolate phosphatase-like HAD superfamily hydrolase
LVLWDVDHTLLEAGPVGRQIYRTAFELLTGRHPVEGPRTDGRTDLAIMTGMLRLNGIDPDQPATEQVLDAVARAGASLRAPLLAGGRALPGAADALAALAGRAGVVQSVLTGNVAPNARLKLGAFGLDRWLDLSVGGYGSDSPVRAELVPVARRRVAERYGTDPGRGGTVLIGDTPRDVEAGRDGGAAVIAVATGAFDPAALADAGADAVLASLTDVDAVLAAVDRLTG